MLTWSQLPEKMSYFTLLRTKKINYQNGSKRNYFLNQI